MKEEGLIRAVGVRGLTAGIINYTLGAGIFVLPALVAAKVGAAAPVVYLICAVAMGLIALCFASAGSRVSMSGGAYAYAEVAFGSCVGFMVAISLWMCTILASASVANVFVDSLTQLSPMIGRPVARTAIMLLLYGVLAAINIRGVRIASNVVQTVTAAKLAPVLILVAAGFTIPGGPVVPILASAIIIWLMSSSTRKEVLSLAAMIAVSTMIFFVMRARRPVVAMMT